MIVLRWAGACVACTKGKVSGTTGLATCAACGLGTFIASTGANACSQCPQGKSSRVDQSFAHFTYCCCHPTFMVSLILGTYGDSTGRSLVVPPAHIALCLDSLHYWYWPPLRCLALSPLCPPPKHGMQVVPCRNIQLQHRQYFGNQVHQVRCRELSAS